MERRYCPSCGTFQYKCPECGSWFTKSRVDQKLCKPSCRQRKSRRVKKDSVSWVDKPLEE